MSVFRFSEENRMEIGICGVSQVMPVLLTVWSAMKRNTNCVRLKNYSSSPWVYG